MSWRKRLSRIHVVCIVGRLAEPLSTRAGIMNRRRFTPYGNGEAGTSTHVVGKGTERVPKAPEPQRCDSWWVPIQSFETVYLTDCNSAATDFISARRWPVYDEDRLFHGHSRRTGMESRRCAREYERRDETRRVYRRLSRYYLLKRGIYDAAFVEG